MITKYKIFENVYRSPKIGDYIIINKEIDDVNDDIIEKITLYDKNAGYFASDYYIEFSDLKKTYWSENKEELEEIINAKKYNL